MLQHTLRNAQALEELGQVCGRELMGSACMGGGMGRGRGGMPLRLALAEP